MENASPINRVLDRLPDQKASGQGRWTAKCPAHEDKHPSLSITTGDDDRVLLMCHAGCTTQEVVTAMGLTMNDLFPAQPSKHKICKPAASKVFATAAEAMAAAGKSVRCGKLTEYNYHDALGKEVMRVLRWDTPEGKTIRPIHRAADGWSIGVPSGLRPLYHRHELSAGVVWICEGEKATDAARTIGLTATTSSSGSKSAAKADWSPLAGRDVVILPDNDEAGRQYAHDAASILATLDPPAKVRIVELPALPDGGDIAEYIDARDSQDNEDIRAGIETLANARPIIDTSHQTAGPVLTCMADVQPSEIAWVWEGRFPLGRLSVLCGHPGDGKSIATMDMAARVSTGSPWPDGRSCPMGSVLLITAEDDPADTIRPRLDAHGAACSKIHMLSMVKRIGDDGKVREFPFSLADVPAMEVALRAHPDTKLVIIDPIGSFLGGKTDSYRDNEVRAVLAPVAALAKKYGAAVLVVAHRRKGAGNRADDLALGSVAFVGIARTVWHLSRDKDNPDRRLFLPGKNNLAKESDGLAFTIEGEPPCISWESDPVRMNADQGLAIENGEGSRRGPEPQASREADNWLRAELEDLQEHPAKEMRAAADAAGISWRTTQRSANSLGVIFHRSGYGKGAGYVWRLPKPGMRMAS